MITHTKYILASSSSSRKSILNNCGFKFKQIKPMCDEEEIKMKIRNKKPVDFVKILSFEKAKSISITKKFFNNYVIGCDTIIHFDNEIIDKAKNIKEAQIKLKKLSGKKHEIISGITICKNGKKVWQKSEITIVKMRKLNTLQINKYLEKTGSQILNSVGCYQIEALGPTVIDDIEGDYFNVLGLPLFKLLKYVSKNK